MQDPIEEKVFVWDQSDGSKFNEINQQILHLEKRLFCDYEPNLGPKSNFISRLNLWLDNLKDETEQKILFELVPNLFYVGREEFNVLYREAYHTIYARWVIESAKIDIYDSNVKVALNTAVKETWFCPLTDSLRINQFYHINDIPGKYDYRPDWRSLTKFGDDNKIKAYVEENKIKRIVLLEDFIGNGSQVSKAVKLAIRLFPEMPLLVVPLIICPKGVLSAKELTDANPNVTINPVISMSEFNFINEEIKGNNTQICLDTYALAHKSYPQVSDSDVIDDDVDPYGPFGWRNTGALIVMYSNTPNNTLPLVHNKSSKWFPLFLRHKRV
jgi:hypothetical protein